MSNEFDDYQNDANIWLDESGKLISLSEMSPLYLEKLIESVRVKLPDTLVYEMAFRLGQNPFNIVVDGGANDRYWRQLCHLYKEQKRRAEANKRANAIRAEFAELEKEMIQRRRSNVRTTGYP